MNLCIMGNQGKKIVLLPGLGTAAPVLDLYLLIKKGICINLLITTKAGIV